MPLLLISLVLLVAIFGFWDTLGAILGGVAILVLLVLLIAALAGWGAYRAFVDKGRRRRS